MRALQRESANTAKLESDTGGARIGRDRNVDERTFEKSKKSYCVEADYALFEKN